MRFIRLWTSYSLGNAGIRTQIQLIEKWIPPDIGLTANARGGIHFERSVIF